MCVFAPSLDSKDPEGLIPVSPTKHEEVLNHCLVNEHEHSSGVLGKAGSGVKSRVILTPGIRGR